MMRAIPVRCLWRPWPEWRLFMAPSLWRRPNIVLPKAVAFVRLSVILPRRS